MYKKLTHQWNGVITGKGLEWGGSRIRPEATGFGALVFRQPDATDSQHWHQRKDGGCKRFRKCGMGCCNESYPTRREGDYDIRSGWLYPMTLTALAEKSTICWNCVPVVMMYVLLAKDGWIQGKFIPNKRPWEVKCDIALQSATQNRTERWWCRHTAG